MTVSIGGDIRRQAFCVSDGTGITIETLGNLLSQFHHVELVTTTILFVTDASHADKVVARIDSAASGGRNRPLVYY